MLREKWFKFGIAIIMLFVIIWLGTKISFIFTPLVIIVQTLFAPIVLAGVLYYLTRPAVNLLSKKIPRILSIVLIFIAIAGLATGAVFLIGPELQTQFNHLVKNFPKYIRNVQQTVIELSANEWFQRFQNDYLSLEKITEKLEQNAQSMLQNIASTIAGAVGFIANIVMVLALIPFVLFFMLKDGKQAPKFLMKVLPKKHQAEAETILEEMDKSLSSYIQGQLVVSLFVGIFAYIGYLIIGLEYSLVLGLLAMVTNVIPFIGPWIGTIPALIVALLTSPVQAIFVVIVAVVVQQIESNFISPFVMGKALNMHPLTIIFVLLIAGQFGGLVGLLLAVPTYALLKVIVSHLYRYIQLD
ncbi:AI-2E family transporter [Bacillus sp. FJAT-50079]|uniref:AI-2E family transporter n=1 Tax=Bacillus sp. FJAT-50079 TaxID=2833577 RepID=UPI001BC9DA45|nr:AI-2E family transporter [Bacillus sp. FJAT-50079]MBS4209904.1 AI-2E family transporter [Bacillus sp. FJAT-50079]